MTDGDRRDRQRRTKAQEWRPDEAPADTAPAWSPTRPELTEWGVTQDEARDLLRRQMCPACGAGPWKSPLNHASRKHGVDRFTMRDICGLTTLESVADPELSARFTERGLDIDMTSVTEASRTRSKQRWTEQGRKKNAETLTDWEKAHPADAAAARSNAGKAGARARWGT